jgi:hypothetical protein
MTDGHSGLWKVCSYMPSGLRMGILGCGKCDHVCLQGCRAGQVERKSLTARRHCLSPSISCHASDRRCLEGCPKYAGVGHDSGPLALTKNIFNKKSSQQSPLCLVRPTMGLKRYRRTFRTCCVRVSSNLESPGATAKSTIVQSATTANSVLRSILAGKCTRSRAL